MNRVLTRRDVAEILSISMRTLCRLEARMEMPTRVQISDQRVGYRADDIEKWIGARTAVKPTEGPELGDNPGKTWGR